MTPARQDKAIRAEMRRALGEDYGGALIASPDEVPLDAGTVTWVRAEMERGRVVVLAPPSEAFAAAGSRDPDELLAKLRALPDAPRDHAGRARARALIFEGVDLS